MPGQHTFRVEPGDTWVTTLTWTDSAGALVNLTGYSATLTIRSVDGTTLTTLTSGSGITLGGAAGTIAISKATAGIAQGYHTYELVMTSGASVITTLLEGGWELVD